MGELTPEALRAFLTDPAAEASRIAQVVETEDSRYLGAVGLSRVHPLFHCILGFSFSGAISESARFRLVRATAAGEGRDAVVVVFRQFERSRYQDAPEDLVAGWAPPDEEDALAAHVRFFNGELARLRGSVRPLGTDER